MHHLYSLKNYFFKQVTLTYIKMCKMKQIIKQTSRRDWNWQTAILKWKYNHAKVSIITQNDQTCETFNLQSWLKN